MNPLQKERKNLRSAMESTFNDGRIQAVDSCVLLRVIDRDNVAQFHRAMELFLSGRDLYVDGVVIAEVIHVLTKESMTRTRIIENLRVLLYNPVFIWDKDFFEPIFDEYLTHPSLSFDDCVIAARVTMKHHTPLWTFDRKFANQSEAAKLL